MKKEDLSELKDLLVEIKDSIKCNQKTLEGLPGLLKRVPDATPQINAIEEDLIGRNISIKDGKTKDFLVDYRKCYHVSLVSKKIEDGGEDLDSRTILIAFYRTNREHITNERLNRAGSQTDCYGPGVGIITMEGRALSGTVSIVECDCSDD